jgi:hypothetical protein
LLKDPVPSALTPATLKSYNDPLVKPVTVAFRDAETPSEKGVHVDEEFNLYCTA